MISFYKKELISLSIRYHYQHDNSHYFLYDHNNHTTIDRTISTIDLHADPMNFMNLPTFTFTFIHYVPLTTSNFPSAYARQSPS